MNVNLLMVKLYYEITNLEHRLQVLVKDPLKLTKVRKHYVCKKKKGNFQLVSDFLVSGMQLTFYSMQEVFGSALTLFAGLFTVTVLSVQP